MGEADLRAEPAALGAYDLSRSHHARQRFEAQATTYLVPVFFKICSA
jgi:hypothetical protein